MAYDINFHQTQYEVFDCLLYHKVNGQHLYDTPEQKKEYEEKRDFHALKFCELMGDDVLSEIITTP